MSGRAEHERHREVREARERRDDEQEDHQRRVHRDEPVERLRVDELEARLRELGAEEHRHEPADREEHERRDQVLDPDHLVVGVDPEVVLPRVRAVARVVLGPRRAAGDVVEPVVERADAREEADRRERPSRRRRGRPRCSRRDPSPTRRGGGRRAALRAGSRGRPSTRRGRGPGRRTGATSSRAAARSGPGTAGRRARDAWRSRSLLLDPLVELGLGHDAGLRAHRRVPEPAELGADDGELAGARRGDEDLRLDAGHGVHLLAELRHPERVDDVDGLHRELRLLAHRENELAGLEVAVVRVLELPRELLADRRHLELRRRSPSRSRRARTR